MAIQGKSLRLEYGIGSIEYNDVKKYQIKFPYVYVNGSRIEIFDVLFIKYGNEIIWRNKKRRR